MEIIEQYHKDCRGRIEGVMLMSYPAITITKCSKCGKEFSREQDTIRKVEIE